MDLRTRTVLRTASAYVDEGTNSTPHELVMTWAHDSITGQPLYIMELGAGRNGNMCGCECASCGQPLKAVNAGKKRGTYIQKPHFKHQAGSVKSTCMVLAARAAALRLLLEDGMLDLPARTISRSWTGLSGATYNGEATTPRQRLSVVGEKFYDRTSAFLQLDDGRRVLVRLTGTNEAPPELEEDDVAYATVFLDINDPALASLDPSELRTRLKLLPETLCWQSHWDDVDLEKRAEIAALEQAQDGLDWTDEDFLDLETLPAELRRETLLHLTVKQLLSEAQQIRVPELVVHETTGLGQANAAASKVLVAEQVMRLSNVRLEQRVGCVIPDVCADCFSQNGQPLGLMCIEVTVTNGFSEERMDRVRTVGMLTLEVDLRNAYGRISRIDLGKVVVDGVLGKRWIHHPDIERCRQDLLEATRDFKPKNATLIPFEHQRRFLEHVMPVRGIDSQEAVARAVAMPTSSGHISPQDDLLRCRRIVELQRLPEWPLDFELVDGLVSLRHDMGLGVHAGLTGIQVAHKLRCSKIDLRLHALILIALKQFCAFSAHKDKKVVDEWAARTRSNVRARDPAWLPSVVALNLLAELFPELANKAKQMIDFVQVLK